MKYLVLSDLHGSKRGCDLLLAILQKENVDRILLLGDILHGGYDGGETFCASTLSGLKDKITAVKGNCDFSSDETLLGFELPERRSLTLFGHEAHLAHRPYSLPFPPSDLVMSGHTHRKTLYKDGGVYYLNPGSISYPRDEVASYAVISEKGIYLKDAETLGDISFLPW